MELNEYKRPPVLSDTARNFVDNFKGGPVPNDIRQELEQFLKESEPFKAARTARLIAQFDKVFKS